MIRSRVVVAMQPDIRHAQVQVIEVSVAEFETKLGFPSRVYYSCFHDFLWEQDAERGLTHSQVDTARTSTPALQLIPKDCSELQVRHLTHVSKELSRAHFPQELRFLW